MQEYADKKSLINEIRKTADMFIREFDGLEETDKDNAASGVDRTPAQMIAYQLGWMALIRSWDEIELAGGIPEMPAPGLKSYKKEGFEGLRRQERKDKGLSKSVQIS
ncbi:MAG: ClbS/DfsB family four-helix bundle protein [Synergistaceae bacterium]|nr:ClbS/DfsB family four-helix bundle protein [Synergistaceae bacterium]